MCRRYGYPDRCAEPLVLLSTYRLDTRYREAARNRLIAGVGTAQSGDRPRLLVVVRRVGATLLAWGYQRRPGPQPGPRIPAHAAAALDAEP